MSDRPEEESKDVIIGYRKIICCSCSVSFHISKALYDLRVQDGAMFYCPNGHGQYYTDSLKERLTKATSEKNHWKAEAARLIDVVDKLREQLHETQKEIAVLKGLPSPAPALSPPPTVKSWVHHLPFRHLIGRDPKA